MTASDTGCCGAGKGRKTTLGESVAGESGGTGSLKKGDEIIDYKVTLLIAAGAAMAANCEMCLNKIVPDLMEAGVAEADIRRAVEIGQFVKDKPAAIMKEAADALTGSRLSKKSVSNQEGCPADKMRAAAAVA
jgi:alkylhydroperoxidase/carboxymuconolactone decarboxylase family protein YurZ